MSEAQRRPKFFVIALLVVIAWFGIGGFTGPLSGQLSDVQTNSNAEFLPENSETTAASVKLERFASSGAAEVVPMTIVFERTNGTFSDADYPAFQSIIQEVIAIGEIEQYLAYVEVNGVQVPNVFPATPEQFALAMSSDGEAFVLNINLDSNKLLNSQGSFQVIGGIVDEVQVIVDAPFSDASGYVTGAIGIFSEFAKAFAGIDERLLLTTLLVVTIILIAVYRSPILWIIPLISAIFSLSAASGLVYYLALNDIIKLNGQSQGILFVLVIGAATDYALLLISRYREELRHDDNKYHAMIVAWKGSWEPIAASAGTVIAGLLCLQLSELRSNAGLGPVGALGIGASLVVSLTFLPAILVLLGRRVFWPFIPHFGSEVAEIRGIWGRVARFVGRKPRGSWIVSTLVLLAMAFGLTQLKAEGVSDVEVFTNQDAKPLIGLRVLEKHNLVPPSVDATIVLNAEYLEDVTAAASNTDGVVVATPRTSFTDAGPVTTIVDGLAAIDITFQAVEESSRQQLFIEDLRNSVREVDGAEALVGGNAAANYDVQQSSRRDRVVIIPIILAVITLILMLLLRSILAPIMLLATVVLSFGAALGASAYVFNYLFDFPGADSSFPLFAFVFLVALGIDYNIFLMTRVREESIKLGTNEGVIKALAVTGGVITSAGIVLAATFAVLGVLPLVFLAQLGFAVAFGVLLDTLLVRSVLVPALSLEIGKKIWWPSKLAKEAD